jgi:MscS family membrane protein
MSVYSDLINQRIFGNTIENYFWFIGIIIAGLLLKRFFFILIGKLAYRLISKNDEQVNSLDFLRILRNPVQSLIFLAFIYVATRYLALPEFISSNPQDMQDIRTSIKIIYKVALIITITWLGFSILNLVELIITRRIEENKSGLNIKIIPFIKEVSKFILVIKYRYPYHRVGNRRPCDSFCR